MFTKLIIRVAALVDRDIVNVSATGQHLHHGLKNGAAQGLSVFPIEALAEPVAKEQPLKPVKTLDECFPQA